MQSRADWGAWTVIFLGLAGYLSTLGTYGSVGTEYVVAVVLYVPTDIHCWMLRWKKESGSTSMYCVGDGSPLLHA
jgi:hypothetical protein